MMEFRSSMFLRNKLRELDEEPMREQLIPEATTTATEAISILRGVYMYAMTMKRAFTQCRAVAW